MGKGLTRRQVREELQRLGWRKKHGQNLYTWKDKLFGKPVPGVPQEIPLREAASIAGLEACEDLNED